MAIENIIILNRIVRGPCTKENPLGKLYLIYNKQAYWCILRILHPTQVELDNGRFDHMPEPDLRRTFELMHPEETTKETSLYE